MRTAPETPGSETPSLPQKLPRNAFKKEKHLPNLLVVPDAKGGIPQTNEQPLGSARSLGTDELKHCHGD